MEETEKEKHQQWSEMFGDEWIPKWTYPNTLVSGGDSVTIAGLRNSSVIPIIGARKVSQLKENLECVNHTLTSGHLDKLAEVSKIKLGFPHDFINSEGVQKVMYGPFGVQLCNLNTSGNRI